MTALRERLTFANVMSVLAVFIALGGSALAVGLAKNSVGTKQIRKNAVRSSDVRNSTLRGVDVKDNSVGGGKLTDASVTGGKLADGSVTGADIDESSLDTSGFTLARSVFEGTCPTNAEFANCTSLQLDLPRASRILVVANVNFATLAANSYGVCRVLVAGVNVAGTLGGETIDTTGNPQANGVGMNGVSAPVGPGTVPVALECRKNAGSLDFFNAGLSAVAVSAG